MNPNRYKRYLLRKPRKLKPMPNPPEGMMFEFFGKGLQEIKEVEAMFRSEYTNFDTYSEEKRREEWEGKD
jgi:hypothetical protein